MTIRLKLIIMFLAAAFIPLLIVSVLTFANYRKSLKANLLSNLENISAFKADKIEEYLVGSEKDLTIAQNSYVVRKNLPVLIRLAKNQDNPAFVDAKRIINDSVLHKMREVFGLADILLVNPEGDIVFATNPKHLPDKHYLNRFGASGHDAFGRGKKGIYVSDIFLDKAVDNNPTMLITGPVLDVNDNFIGVIAFQVDMDPIYKLIQDVTGLKKTGETLIGKKIDNEVVFLNPLRHDPQAALIRRVRIGEALGGPIQEAVKDRSGSGELTDYRGKKVIAAWRNIPSLGWGMVAKIDAQEAFAEVVNLRNLVILILYLVFFLATIIAFSLSNSIAKPIKKLSKGAEIVGSGNLDYKVGTNLQDEIGQLSRSFDKMTQDLKAMSASRDAERQRLYEVLETLPIYVVLFSKDYCVFFANRFFRERFGDSSNKRCYEYLFKRSQPCVNCQTYKVLQTGSPQKWEWAGPDGRNYDVHDFPFIDTDGSRMILEMGIDITERKKAEAELKKYQDNLEALVKERTSELQIILDSVPAMIFYKDSKNNFIRTNSVFESAMGLPKEKLEGKSIFDLYPKEQAEAYWKDDLEVIKSGKAKRGIIEPMDSPQGRRLLQTDKLPYLDEQGNVAGVIGFAIDITERKKMEDELKRSNESLEQFAYVASHDLQEPLRIMSSYSQLLEKRYKERLDSDAKDFIAFIVDAAARMQKLIIDLLSYSRLGRKDIPLAQVDFNEVLNKVIYGMSSSLESSSSRVTHDDLPVLMAHETNIMQLFQNLIGNAMKFRSEAAPSIHVSARKDGRAWIFSVRDNGIGIEPQYQEKIFQIFQRLNSREKYSGTGIGLSICRKIVENCGGKMWVESQLGKGSTFYFTIPEKGANNG